MKPHPVLRGVISELLHVLVASYHVYHNCNAGWWFPTAEMAMIYGRVVYILDLSIIFVERFD